MTTNVPYGYLKDPENPRRWKIDPVAADVVRRIFSMCMEGRGPQQIANQPKADKVLTPTAYKTLQGIKSPNKKPEDPYGWGDSTVVRILERREYTGCTVNFKTYTNSIWDKKQRDNPIEKQAIFPNTHERIIDDDVFEKVQEIRQQRHRMIRTGRSSIFSGLVYCADCGSKMLYGSSNKGFHHFLILLFYDHPAIRRDPLFAYFADEWICILQLNRFIARSMPSEIRTLAASPARSRASIRAL